RALKPRLGLPRLARQRDLAVQAVYLREVALLAAGAGVRLGLGEQLERRLLLAGDDLRAGGEAQKRRQLRTESHAGVLVDARDDGGEGLGAAPFDGGGPGGDDPPGRSPLAKSVLLGDRDRLGRVGAGGRGLVHEGVEQRGEREGRRVVDWAAGMIGPGAPLRGERARRGEISPRHCRERRRAERV